MKMKLKVKPRAEPEKKKGDEVVSKVGAKLNNAFERLVATLGYDATQDDYDAMDEEEEPQIVEAKQQKEKHGLADEATSGGLEAGLQTLAKQLHAFGHHDVVPFSAGESDAFDDVDDFDLCEEVVSSEEPAGDQPATDAAVAASAEPSPKQAVGAEVAAKVEESPVKQMKPVIEDRDGVAARESETGAERRNEAQKKEQQEKKRREVERKKREVEEERAKLAKKRVDDEDDDSQGAEKVQQTRDSSSEDEDDHLDRKEKSKKEREMSDDDKSEEEDRRPIGERIRERQLDDGEEDEEDELINFLNGNISDDEEEVQQQQKKKTKKKSSAQDSDYEPTTSASKKRRRPSDDSDREEGTDEQSKKAGKRANKKEGPPSKRQKKKVAKEVESAREKASRVTQKILRQGRLNFERIEAPEVDVQALANRLIRRSAILRNTPMAVPRLSADTKPPRAGGGLYVCPPSVESGSPKEAKQKAEEIEVEGEVKEAHDVVPPKIGDQAAEEKEKAVVEEEPIQPMPANWAAASLEMPMETTQELWSMSRGDDEADEQPKSAEEASKPALDQQAQQFDPVMGLALTYEPTLDPSLSLVVPLDHPVNTPAMAVGEDDDLGSIFGGAASSGDQKDDAHADDDDEAEKAEHKTAEVKEMAAVAVEQTVGQVDPAKEEVSEELRGEDEDLDDEEALIAELEGRSEAQEEEDDDDDDDEENEEDEDEDEEEEEAVDSKAKATSYHTVWQNEREDEELKAIMRRFCPSELGEDDDDDDDDEGSRHGGEDEARRQMALPQTKKSEVQVWDMYDKEEQEEDEDDDDDEDDDGSDKENGKGMAKRTNPKFNGNSRKAMKKTTKKPAPSSSAAGGSIFGGASSLSLSLTSSLSMMDDQDELETMNLIKRIQKTNSRY